MITFNSAVQNQSARTTNDMKARKSTANSCVDLFYKIGASRGKDIIPNFVAALVEDEDIALRIAQWARDVRGGAGERELFRQVLLYLEKHKPDLLIKILPKVPVIGRWDDLLIFESEDTRNLVYAMIKVEIYSGNQNQLMYKWLPREKSAKGSVAKELRKYLGISPKQYRKLLVESTNVVETQMCNKDWDNINFSHVPSLAAARYKKAFYRNTEKFAEYVAALVKGDDPKVKVNAGAVYPYDVLKGLISVYKTKELSTVELDFVTQQWNALENFIGDANVLPLIDVSGSMTCSISADHSNTTSCLEVAVSLGLYCADKNKGKFNGTFLTFSGSPELVYLKGNIVEKIQQINKSNWEMNTDLIKAMEKILSVAIEGNVSEEEMPEILLIFSDMQFDQCARFDDSAMEMIRRKFTESGYNVPKIVFWNLNANDNVPVKYNEKGVAMVSGFSPAIMKAILSCDMDDFTPESIMKQTVMQPRYDI